MTITQRAAIRSIPVNNTLMTTEEQTQPNAPETNGSEDETSPQEEQKEIMLPKARFDEVNSKYKEVKARLDEIETKTAEEQGKFKELAEKRDQELRELREKYTGEKRQTAIMRELQKLNPSNLDAALRLVDMEKVTVEDDGTITGADEAVKAVQSFAPEFFTKVPPSDVGVKTPTQATQSRKFKLSEIRDPKFRAENWDEIDKAEKEGRIDYRS